MMHLNYNRTVYALVLFISLLFFAACSDDTSGGSTVEQCPAGEFYNALNGRCELRGRDGNNDPTLNNNPADAGPGDESDADNPADSGHGNDISEDGDASAPGDWTAAPRCPTRWPLMSVARAKSWARHARPPARCSPGRPSPWKASTVMASPLPPAPRPTATANIHLATSPPATIP